jgi:D-alanyl-lipoteichoic acid acyltransferase DltB (MBOAT superfamily)
MQIEGPMGSDIFKYLKYSFDEPMFFTSGIFWAFLALAILIYSAFYKKPVLRHSYLLLVSLYFYYQAGGWFFLMLIFSTLVDYFLGLKIHSAKTKKAGKLLLATSIVINLLVLAYFKYAYFITDLFQGLTGVETQTVNIFSSLLNRTVGTNYDIHTIILPVGVSFYTFQTISYTIDVYRKHVKPVRSIIDFGFYVSFFPQLVAGPIVRAAEFIPQLYQKYALTASQFWHAVFLIMGGLVKKILIADYLAIGLVDRVFESPLSFSGFENLVSMYSYAVQIYFDFSGYTDIAIGVALLFGFKLPINFNEPYQASSLTDFWRRWHISLSSWLRDYLYIPLGGNRKGKIRTGLHVLLTMFLGGLWHGAHLKFALWGFYHGVILLLEKLFAGKSSGLSYKPGWKRLLSRVLTFHIVLLGWLIFRADTPAIAWVMLKQVFVNFEFGTVLQFIRADAMLFIMLVGSFILIALPAGIKELIRGWFILRPYWLKILIVLLTLFLLYEFQISELKPFIYFQF